MSVKYVCRDCFKVFYTTKMVRKCVYCKSLDIQLIGIKKNK